MKKMKQLCKFCKYCLGNHNFTYCGSKLSSYYNEEVYPLSDCCEVFYRSKKKKKIYKSKDEVNTNENDKKN